MSYKVQGTGWQIPGGTATLFASSAIDALTKLREMRRRYDIHDSAHVYFNAAIISEEYLYQKAQEEVIH